MVFDLFRGGGDSQVDSIEAEISQMLTTATESLGLALDALVREVEPGDVGSTLRKRDRSINKVERAIRRQLIVHAGVRGTQADVPLLFTYMSIAKDIERVGDMSKDLWDLAAAGGRMNADPYRSEAMDVGHDLTTLITDTARVFGERDAESAIAILNIADERMDDYEGAMLSQLKEPSAQIAVTRSLFYRYAARITAHLMNVLTAVVMPFERLDYYDEDKIDRE